jgi:hypothetical protein
MKPTASALHCAKMTGLGFLIVSALSILTSIALAGGVPDNLQPLPETDLPSIKAPPTAQEITQIREQNAVVSVRVKRGDNTYYVTPSEQFSESQNGGRAAQWQIFEFRSKKETPRSALPPPSLQR